MIVFSILQVPMTEWELGPNAQDLFDSVFNYFPITFKPPPGDPYGITAQDLKDRLRACISSTSDFAPYAFPALLDKLDSTSMNTKRDVLSAIIACVENYEPRTISLYSVTLWDALKFEILNPQEDDLAEESLRALGLIAKQLSLAGEGALTAYLKPIIKECNEHLEDAPTKQSQAAGRIMSSIMRQSPDLADILTKSTLPHLFQLFQGSESISKRRGLIEVLNYVIEATIEISSQWQTRNEDGLITADRSTTNALRNWSGESLEAMLRAVISAPKGEISFRLIALKGLAGLVAIPQLLDDSEVSRIVGACTDIIIQEQTSGQDEIQAASVTTLIGTAHHAPNAVADRALPALLAELPDNPPEGSSYYAPILEAFAKLSTETQIFDTIVLRLKNKLNIAVHQRAPRHYLVALLASLLYAFTYGAPGKDEDGLVRFSYFTDIVKPLLDQAVDPEQAETSPLADEVIVDVIGKIGNIVLRPHSMHTQNKVYADYEWIFNTLSGVGQTESGPLHRLDLFVIASLHLHAAFKRDITEPETSMKLLRGIGNVLKQHDQSPLANSAALRHISLLTNKYIPSAEAEQSLTASDVAPASLLQHNANPRTVRLAFAVAKGLIVQGKSVKYTTTVVESLLQLLSDHPQGAVAARGFSTLLAPDDALTKENHCFVSGLHKQKLFNLTVPAITAAVKTADPAVKPNYLVALSGILRWLPYSILEHSLNSLSPLLLQSLDLQDASQQDIKAATLATLESVLLYDPAAIQEHASSLISRLLSSTAAPVNGPDVRKGALQCLALVPKQLKREIVVPFRAQVVKKLVACLDDRKRVVRAEAVRCRSAWLGLDAGDEEEEE